MSPPVARGRARRPDSRRKRRERRLRRLALLVSITLVAAAALLLSAFGGSAAPARAPAAMAATQLLPAGPPGLKVLARLDQLHIQLPISQSRVTAIGYQSGSDGALALSPLGTQANQGVLKRLLHRVVGGSTGSPRWYQLPGGPGPATSALDVGAAAGTDVYSPVDGTIVGLDEVVLNGRAYGSRIDIQPSGAPSLVLSVSHVRSDPALVVGSPVTAGGSRLGSVVDFQPAEHQALARYTNDAGNHIVIEVHPSATLSVD